MNTMRNFSENEEVKKKGFNEQRVYEGGKVDNIVINLPYSKVNVHQSFSSKTKIKLVGGISLSGEINFRIYLKDRTLLVLLHTDGEVVSSNLRLQIFLPIKNYKLLSILGTSNICIEDKVFTKMLRVKTEDGKVETNAVFEKATLKSVSGDIDVSTTAESDIEVNASTTSGNISKLNNVREANINKHTISGFTKSVLRKTRGYTALIEASSTSGNIFVG